jgi:hypothetical protein
MLVFQNIVLNNLFTTEKNIQEYGMTNQYLIDGNTGHEETMPSGILLPEVWFLE